MTGRPTGPTAKRGKPIDPAGQRINPSGEPIKASGDVLRRWQWGDADAYLFEGDCRLEHGGKRFVAESILMVVDGEAGRIRNRVVLDGVLFGDGRRGRQPLAAVEYTTTVPEVRAPRMRGAPAQRPTLLDRLPDAIDTRPNDTGPNDTGPNDTASSDSAIGRVAYDEGIPQQGIPLTRPADLTPPADLPPPAETPHRAEFPDETGGPGSSWPANPEGLPESTLDDRDEVGGGFQFLVGGGTRSVEIVGRGTSTPPSLESINRPESGETVVIARNGVTVLVRDVSARLPGGELMQLGTISLSADRIVGWLPLAQDLFSGASDLSQSEGELYLEGDIVFRQGERVIYADAMYFNVTREMGVVLDAEAITTIPEYQGIVRLKADVLRQVSKGNFVAFDAAVTSSRMGVPRYWLQSRELRLTDRRRVVTDPDTGVPRSASDPYVSSTGNFVYLGGVPILYWPRFATSLTRPGLYLKGAKFSNDNIFGTQAMLEWDLFQLLGWESAPEGLESTLSTDYFSDRGPAIGSKTDYRLPGLLGIPGPVIGNYDSWIIDDDGRDTLGSRRRNLPPEESIRGRSLLRHRHYLPGGYEFTAELGYVSDRNFLEQYLENEWDQDKDHDTAIRLRRYAGIQMLDLSANLQVNDFFQETEHLPRLEHYAIGSSWLGDRLTWSAHHKVGYSRLNVADAPRNPAEAASFTTLPGEADRRGVEAGTRQELSLPVAVGPVNVAPFVSGEASHYGEGADGDEVTRLLGQAGVRASLAMWRADPTIQSALLNVRGLAHKAEWSFEYFAADSDTNLDELPLYDPLDDNAQEQFRRRFIFDNHGGVLPTSLDPRVYALRQGTQRWVTSPSDVIADDLQQVRLGLHQRLQTKRGLPGRERITDLVRFDVDTILFPDAQRDNFGETLGPTTYAARYHVGDRVALLSDGYFDFFDLGLRSISAGMRASRPGVGDVYVGLLSIEGPVSSTVLRTTLDYRLNEKWISNFGTTYDFGEAGNVGQSIGITRIGESFLLRVGVNVDPGRDNVGVGFAIEPRFLPSSRLGRLGGQMIPPPGSEGLE